MRKWNSLTSRWEQLISRYNSGDAWIDFARAQDQDSAVQLVTAFDHEAGTYLGRGTILQRDISKMPIHPDSDAMAQFMWNNAPFSPGGAYGPKTSLNTSSWGTQPIHMWVVDSTHPDCNFRTFDATAIGTSQTEIDTYMKGAIPLPSWAVPAPNGDRGIAIYDVATGIMRELFGVDGKKDQPDVWGGVGGYSIGNPGLNDLSKTNWPLQQRRGISNVAGMHNSLGFIGIAEAFNKKIDHALCFTVATLGHTGDPSWPARGGDGKAENYAPGGSKYDPQHPNAFHNGVPISPYHGQWGRLKESVDPMYNPRTGKPYGEFLRVVIDAAKRRGLVATDTNLWCHSFNAEQGRGWAHVYGSDPWSSGLLNKLYVNKYGEGDMSLAEFPWDQTEWAPKDWGRPVPDFNLRPGQLVPWGV